VYTSGILIVIIIIILKLILIINLCIPTDYRYFSLCLQCLLYRTQHAQDVKKIEKFTGLLMRHMASKDTKWTL